MWDEIVTCIISGKELTAAAMVEIQHLNPYSVL